MTIWKGAALPQTLNDNDFATAAAALRCEPAAIRAVWEVEAGGRHFLSDGSVIRRFEPHHFPSKYWYTIGFAPRAGEAPWRASLRLSSETMFRKAVEIDVEAAMRASSWGAPQIMGFNATEAGFGSAREMVEHMAKGAPQQLGAFVQLLDAWGLGSALRGHDWTAFARRYNGSGQPEVYGRKIEAAYRRHSGVASPVVLSVGARGADVQRLQHALGIEVDGAFGPRTRNAVIDFQRREGLAEDGVVGANTWAALETVASVRAPMQDTPTEALADQVRNYAGAASGASFAVSAVSEALPEQAVTWLMAAAAVALVLAVAAWAYRKATR